MATPREFFEKAAKQRRQTLRRQTFLDLTVAGEPLRELVPKIPPVWDTCVPPKEATNPPYTSITTQATYLKN